MTINHKLKLVSAAVFCGFLLASAQRVSATNTYLAEGERVMDMINSNFYDNSTGRYVDHITTATLAKSSASCDCWPAANIVQALLWGTVNKPSAYTNRLNSFIGALSWYVNGPGYGSTHGGERFFDDNALMAESLMRAWGYKSGSTATLNAANFALFYDFDNKDSHWGLPQTEANLGQGHWYVGPGASQGVAFGIYYAVSGGATNLSNAVTFWNKINDPTMLIKDATTSLIHEGVQYTNGAWVVTGGVVAGATARTINLGIEVYHQNGDNTALTTAETIGNALLNKWYTAGAGLNCSGDQGGLGSVMALCQLYGATGDATYKTAAQGICDFLMNSGKDTGGYYPANGLNWNVVQTGQAPPTTVDVMSQTTVAAALLCFAYVDINGHFPPFR